ncbi:hypothetical protein ACTNA5_08375, partial [Collinsella bouchesdurhonensis]
RPVIHGVEVSVPSIGGHGLWPEPCNPGQGPKHGGNSATLMQFPGNAVWAAEECAAVGLSEAELSARAVEKLKAVEPIDVERHFAALLKKEPNTASSIPQAEATMLAEGLTPTVHVRPSDLPRLIESRQVISTAGVLRTIMGSPVAAGAGYETDLDGTYVTGSVTVYRNQIETHNSFTPATNLRFTVAERAFAVVWLGTSIKINEGS